MRSPGVIYRKYRNIKRKYLYEKVLESRKKCFENCFYSKNLDYTDHLNKNRHIKLCTVNKNIDVCSCPVACNAFISKINKNNLKKEFEDELKDYAVKKYKYPDLLELEWVLDKNLKEAIENPSIIEKCIIYIINILESLLKNIHKNK